MMDRSQKLAILNAASDESLDHALDALGIASGAHDEYGEEASGADSKLTPWQDMDVSVPATHREPFAGSKASLFLQRDKPRAQDQLGLPQAGDDEAEMLAHGLM